MSEVEEVVLLKMNEEYLSPEVSFQKGFLIDALWQSLFDVRVKIALAEKGIKYKTKEEDYGSPKSPLLLEMNPLYEQVPVLIHNGKPIIQSLIIVEYIDETWSGQGSSLLPSNPHERSIAKYLVDDLNKKILATAGELLKDINQTKWEKDINQTKWERSKIGKGLLELFGILEQLLEEKDYFGGLTFGFMDIAMLPFISLFPIIHFLTQYKLDDHCPYILQWADRCSQRESVSNNMLDPLLLLSFVSSFLKTEEK